MSGLKTNFQDISADIFQSVVRLKMVLDGKDDAISALRLEITGKDQRLEDLRVMRCGWCKDVTASRPLLDSHVVSCEKNPAVQEQAKLRAELKAANEKADDATGLLRRLWNTAGLNGLAKSFQSEIATFLNPPALKVEDIHAGQCPHCCIAGTENRQSFRGHMVCEECRAKKIQSMLGAPVRAK